MLFVTVANGGARVTNVNTPYLVLPDRKKFVFLNPQSSVTYPHKLEDGANCVLWIDMNGLSRSLRQNGFSGKVRLHAEVSDATDTEYQTKKSWLFDKAQWQ